jgi:transposase-like protein
MAKRGRKTIYEPNRHPKIAGALARNGCTDVEIAKLVGISRKTFYEWRKMYPDFSDIIKKGKLETDLEVENALLKRALGYEYEETEMTVSKVMVNGKEVTRPGKIKKTKKIIPPDVGAICFWLKNRQKDKWRDVQTREISGPGGGPVELASEVAKEVANMTPEERQARINELITKRTAGALPAD